MVIIFNICFIIVRILQLDSSIVILFEREKKGENDEKL